MAQSTPVLFARRGGLPAAAMLLVVLLGSCGGADDTVDAGPSRAGAQEAEAHPPRPEKDDGPPPVTLRFENGSMTLRANTYCWGSVCVDGVPAVNPPDVGSPEEIVVQFPLRAWTFTATFVPAGEQCGRRQTVTLNAREDGSFLLRPAGYAATYDVMLAGRGNAASRGDLATHFRWTTRATGPLPVPQARLGLLAGRDGRVDSYGVELTVENLARTPSDARAWVTAHAANGAGLSFEATRGARACQPEGSVFFNGPDDQGRAAAALGPAPFRLEVVLVLDGERHVATARWPDDQIAGNEPYVGLTFEPPLPRLA